MGPSARRQDMPSLSSFRCALPPATFEGMKNDIVNAVKAYVDIEVGACERCERACHASHFENYMQDERRIDVNVHGERDTGAVYTVSVPVRRVKEQLVSQWGDVQGSWDPQDPKSDPSGQMPWGA